MSTSPTPILRSIERDSNGLPTRVYSTSAGLKFAAVLDQRDKRRRQLLQRSDTNQHAWMRILGQQQYFGKPGL